MNRICMEESMISKYFRSIYSFISQKIPNLYELLIINFIDLKFSQYTHHARESYIVHS